MYALLRPLLFTLDPTKAHAAAMAALGPVEHLSLLRALLRGMLVVRDERLEVRKMGIVFPGPLGVAAGFDKNGDRSRALAAIGFGHIELGTVTAEAQGPNPPPNMFRLPSDRAIVNRLGFPNEGASIVAARLERRKKGVRAPLGVSIGKSRSVPIDDRDAVRADYIKSFRAVRGVADFVVVNVSSPNTKDLRSMQSAEVARDLFRALMVEAGTDERRVVPILVKIAPDLDSDAIDAICDVAMEEKLAGVVATNTTISRDGLTTPQAAIESIGAGGLSGLPLFPRALEVVKRVRTRVGKSACVIGVGGVHGTESALAMLRAGADLVQIYTSFVYEGPLLPRAIARGLVKQMDREGARSLLDLVSSSSSSSTSSTSAASSGAGKHTNGSNGATIRTA